MAGTVTLLHLLFSLFILSVWKCYWIQHVSAWPAFIYRALLLSVANINCISNIALQDSLMIFLKWSKWSTHRNNFLLSCSPQLTCTWSSYDVRQTICDVGVCDSNTQNPNALKSRLSTQRQSAHLCEHHYIGLKVSIKVYECWRACVCVLCHFCALRITNSVNTKLA